MRISAADSTCRLQSRLLKVEMTQNLSKQERRMFADLEVQMLLIGLIALPVHHVQLMASTEVRPSVGLNNCRVETRPWPTNLWRTSPSRHRKAEELAISPLE